METVNCDLCGYNNYEVLAERGRFNLFLTNVVCKKCGLIFINPRMEESEYSNFNLNDYRRIYKKPEKPTEDFVRYQLYRGSQIYSFLSGQVGKNIRVLDIGSTVGGVLEALRQKLDSDSYGIEIAAELGRYAAEHFRVKMFYGFFEDSNFPKEYFDLIIMSHVLEHCYYPSKVLAKAKEILKDDGKLYIEVPNIFRPYGAIESFFQVPHPYTFSPKTLMGLCQKTGWGVIKSDFRTNIRLLLKKDSGNRAKVELNNDGHYLEIISALKAYRIKYALFLRYLNFLRERFYMIKSKLGKWCR